jgi:hypothetical protein
MVSRQPAFKGATWLTGRNLPADKYLIHADQVKKIG